MKKAIKPGALVALKEALSSAYWYKSDLRSFLSGCLRNSQELLVSLDWSSNKRVIVANLVDRMASRPSAYQGHLLHLMTETGAISNFSHLERLDDGMVKAERAREAVNALRQWVKPHEEMLQELEAASVRRKKAYQQAEQVRTSKIKLDSLKDEFLTVIAPAEPHRRGYKLEGIVRELLELFQMNPRGPFKTSIEQIDGAFSFDGTDYILEVKWHKDLVNRVALDTFRMKVERKLENTLGLFVSMNGFQPSAVAAHSTMRPSILLADGSDLMAVLEGRIDLAQLLLRKRRHAAETGEIYIPIHQILLG